MSYLDNRSQKVLRQIVDHPTITGKNLEVKLNLSRKQLSYTIEKINHYLLDSGYEKIERLKTGKFAIPSSVMEEFKTEGITFKHITYIFSDKERLDIITLLLLCRQEELSTYHFISTLGVSKNTILSDMKKLQEKINKPYGLSVLYSRKDGYTLIGNEYAKREVLVCAIRKVLKLPNGDKVLEQFCNLKNSQLIEMKKDILAIESALEIQFTDDRLLELPYILCVIIHRIQTKKLLNTIPEAFQHIIGTKEYAATTPFSSKYKINNQLEKMFISAQIQISNIHYVKADEYRTEKKLLQAADEMITNFEALCCIKIKERNLLLEALLQHCKPAFYRIKYNYHIENSMIDMVLPQHSYLHEITKKAAEPFIKLIGHSISDEELVYLTVLFGAWLRKEGVLDIIEEQKKVIVVCTNGVSVSNFLLVTLKELFPEFKFLRCLSIREFKKYKEHYDIVFSTVRLETKKTQFIVKPFLSGYSKQNFREKVIQEIEGVRLHTIQMAGLLHIIERSASIHSKDQLIRDLNYYINEDCKKEEQLEYESDIGLEELLTKDKIILQETTIDWKDAIKKTAKPLLDAKDIEQRYVDKMIEDISENKPFIMVADGVIIAHAGIMDGVNQISMSLMKLSSKIDINGYLNADLIVVLATPDTTKHVTALYKFIEITESIVKMREIRNAKNIEDILNVIKKERR